MDKVMPFTAFLWRFADGSTGIDILAMKYLCQWLTEDEAQRLCCSLSASRLSRLDQVIREYVLA